MKILGNITLLLTTLFIVYYVVNHGEVRKITATVAMDGKGHYLLSDYKIDDDGCLSFVDFTDVPHHFCGAYEVVPIEEYYITPEKELILSYY